MGENIREKLLPKLEILLEGTSETRSKMIRDVFDVQTDPNTPGHLIKFNGFKHTIDDWGNIDTSNRELYEWILNEIYEYHLSKGFLSTADYLTTQEQMVIGGTPTIDDCDEPHKPLGLIIGEHNIEKINRAREVQIAQYHGVGYYFGLDEPFVWMSLELLDEEGNTIRDPIPLDDQLKPILSEYRDDFPFRRA